MSKNIKVVIIICLVIALLGIFFLINETKNQADKILLTKNTIEPIASSQESTQSVKTNKMQTPDSKKYTAYPEMLLKEGVMYSAILKTPKGDIKIKLFDKETPKAVNNFVFLAKEGFYDGTKFHRIIKGFMLQGGDPEGTGRGGPGYRFDDESIKRDYKRGTVAMANAGPNTNGSQFFIMHADYPLPKNYVIFGEVVEGLETVDAIASVKVKTSLSGESSTPLEDVTLESVEISESTN
ncbi:MAG: peptidylprolyl isomerase [Patescibacteria group bacterium]